METTKLTIEEIEEQIRKLQKAKEDIKKEEAEKLAKEKESRKAEVDEALMNYVKVRDAYIRDYGYYVSKNKNCSDFLLDFFG